MKLFKKVAAAVLAGVMALSMVACGATGTIDPSKDTPAQDTPASSSAVTDVLKWMNSKRGMDDYGNEKKAFENDAALAKKAEVILNAVAADLANTDTQKKNIAYQVNGSVATYWQPTQATSNLSKALALAGADQLKVDEAVYYIADNKVVAAKAYYAAATSNMDISIAQAYNLDSTLKQELETKAAQVTNKDAKVGVASKTIEGKTYVIIITDKNFNYSTTSGGTTTIYPVSLAG